MFATALTLMLCAAPQDSTEIPGDLTFSLHSGVSALVSYVDRQPGSVSGLSVDDEVSVTFRWRSFEAGSFARVSDAFAAAAAYHFGGFAGVAKRAESGWRLELVLTGGLHHADSLGAHSTGLLGFPLTSGSVTEGFAVDLPFAGVRAGAYKTFFDGTGGHFTFGVTAHSDVDLLSARGQQRSATWCGLGSLLGGPCGGSGTQPVDSTIGTLGLLVTFGWTRDLGL